MTPAPAVFCLSCGALAFEILLVRVLHIIQWHHFAFMIISLALLGYGASGTVLTIAQNRLLDRFPFAFAASAVGFSLSSLAAIALAQHIRFNPLEMLWDAGQFGRLFKVYLVLSLPFFFAASGAGLALARHRGRIHRIYLADLLGAGTGAAAALGLLTAFSPTDSIRIASTLGFVAAALGLFDPSRRRTFLYLAGLAGCALLWSAAFPHALLAPRVSEYKGLSMALRTPGARIVEERHSPLGWVVLVESPKVPFRIAQGLSLACDAPVPAQLGLFIDGDGPIPVLTSPDRSESTAYLDCLLTALPYRLVADPRVLVLGLGGGTDAVLAHRLGAASVDAVETNADLLELVRKASADDAAGGASWLQRTHIHLGEPRSTMERTSKNYDLIHLSALGALSGSAAGAHGLSETYGATVEAFETYLEHLAPGGFLAVTQTIALPPRATLKLVATVLSAMERTKTPHPEQRLAVLRNWNTALVLVKKGAITESESAAIRSFSEAHSFDLVFLPGIESSEINRFNVLERPYFHEGVRRLLEKDRDTFLHDYPFDLKPATDDRPYFFHFFKWSTFPEFFALRGRGGLPLIEWAYPVLAATLGQAALSSIVLVMLPLRFLKRPGNRSNGPLKRRAGPYFLSLGLAFLFVEIALIQKFILLLGRPIYAMTATVAPFLVCAGLGSGFSKAWASRVAGAHRFFEGRAIGVTALLVGLIVLSAALLLPGLVQYLMPAPAALRWFAALGIAAPLAFFMGMPFPLGLSLLSRRAETLIPWAWGVNGFASVLSAVLTMVFAIHWGYRAVLLSAAMLYLVAAVLFWNED